MRRFAQWISRHRNLSVFLSLAFIGIFFVIKTIGERSDGTLSAPLQKGRMIDAVYGIGTVTATRSFSIKPGIIETIDELFVNEGDFVKGGANLARIDHNYYKAPFSGTINFLPFKIGENVFASSPVLVLTDLSNRYVVVSLEQQGALRVRPGQKAKLSFDTIRNQSYDGEVKSVYSYNGSFLARINAASLPPEILPDMTADIAIIIREIPDALIIPVAAYENGFVWVKRGHRIPIKVPVTLGVVDGASAQIASGELQAGDTLLIHRKLAP